MFTKFASYKVPPVMVSTHGSVVPLAMFFVYIVKTMPRRSIILKIYRIIVGRCLNIENI